MRAADTNTERLSPGALLCIDDGYGRWLRVHKGVIWLTQECDARDVFLVPGDALRLDHRGRAVVQAISPSTFSVSAAQRRAGHWAQRVASHWQRRAAAKPAAGC